MSNEEIRVAWSPEEFVEAKREFRGRIVRVEWGSADPESKYYNSWVFPPDAPEDIRQRQAERGQIAIRVEIMPVDRPWNNIYEWYGLSDVRLTKWYYFLQSLKRLNVDVNMSGNTNVERLNNFCSSLVGCEFKWEDNENLPTVGGKVIKRLLLPVEYYGRFEVGKIERVEV